MRNSELGCGGTEQQRGVAVALSYGDAAARGRWHEAEVVQCYGGARSGDAVAWGCKSGGARCYWFSKRSSKEIDDISISAHPFASLLIHLLCVPLRNSILYLQCSACSRNRCSRSGVLVGSGSRVLVDEDPCSCKISIGNT